MFEELNQLFVQAFKITHVVKYKGDGGHLHLIFHQK